MRTGDIMSTDAASVALEIMETKQLHRLPVIDEHDQLIGIISPL